MKGTGTKGRKDHEEMQRIRDSSNLKLLRRNQKKLSRSG